MTGRRGWGKQTVREKKKKNVKGKKEEEKEKETQQEERKKSIKTPSKFVKSERYGHKTQEENPKENRSTT